MRKVRLCDLCLDILSGGTPETKDASLWNGEVPWISSADISDSFEITPKKYISAKAKAKILPANNILIVTRVGLGKIGTNNYPIAFSQDIQGLLIKDQVHVPYLIRALSVEVQKFKNISRGATIKGVTRDDLKQIEIFLPDLSIQKQIAQTLAAADRARQQRKAANALTEQFLQSSFLHLFGDPVQNEKDWEVTSLKNIAVLENGDRSSNYPTSKDLVKKGIPFLGTHNIVDNRLQLENLRLIGEGKFDILSRGKLKQHDLIITLRGSLGHCAIFESEVYKTGFINAQMLIVRPENKNLSFYLWRVFNQSEFRNELLMRSSGSAVPQLTAKQISDLKIPLPPLHLQQHFASLVADTERLRQKQQESEKELEHLFQALLQQYFGQSDN